MQKKRNETRNGYPFVRIDIEQKEMSTDQNKDTGNN